jgi:hypothetical protein
MTSPIPTPCVRRWRALGSIDTPDVVPILASLFDDHSVRVRLSAAYALIGMKDSAALDALTHALDVDYGKEEGKGGSSGIVQGFAHACRPAVLPSIV